MRKASQFLAIILCAFSCILFAEEPAHEFKGTHFIASYIGCDHEALADVNSLREAMYSAVEQSGATLLKAVDYVFPPDGFTMVVLLSESHASIHTYPEYNACFVDLFTCGNNCTSEKFDEALKAYLKPTTVSHKVLVRDQGIENQ